MTVNRIGLLPFISFIIILFLIFSCQRRNKKSDGQMNQLYMLEVDSIPGAYLSKLDGQTVDITVYEPDKYNHYIDNYENELLLGSDLFLYMCVDCHSPNKQFDSLSVYTRSHDLNDLFLKGKTKHIKLSFPKELVLDSFDLRAINKFISRYMESNIMNEEIQIE